MSPLAKLQQQIPNNTAYLLSNTGDIAYFTQFEFLVPEEREALLLVTTKTATLLHASFSPVNVPAEISRIPGCDPEKLKNQVNKIITSEKIKQLLVDKHRLFVTEFEVLEKIKQLTIAGLNREVIWQLRSVKSDNEIKYLKKAGEITSKALAATLDSLEAGMSELEVENYLETMLDKYGSQRPAFPTIVAFAEHSALPHHQPTPTKLKKDMPVLIDVGATHAGYCSDMTRTIWFGDQPAEQFLKLEKVVVKAYQAALDSLKTLPTNDDEPLVARDIDQAARSVIDQHNYGQQFIHTTGHGLGLSIHEQPSLSWVNETEIKPNMVVTIEPGIYLKGKFGYRYENTVLVGDELEELTNQ